MVEIYKKILEYLNNLNLIRKINRDEMIFSFLLGLKNKHEQFKINISTKCLVLAQYPGAEIKGLGGLIAQNPKNFEVLCLTNGSDMITDINPLESASIKKQQFDDIMKLTRIKGYKIFDIDSKTLKNHYSTFKKIDISEVDYIFIPNVYDNNIDTIALLKHFKQILQTKDHKPDLKILMYESDFSLCTLDYYVDISSIIETKKKLLKMYYPEDKYPGLVDKIIGINSFRSIQYNKKYVEAFLSFSTSEFLEIPMI